MLVTSNFILEPFLSPAGSVFDCHGNNLNKSLCAFKVVT